MTEISNLKLFSHFIHIVPSCHIHILVLKFSILTSPGISIQIHLMTERYLKQIVNAVAPPSVGLLTLPTSCMSCSCLSCERVWWRRASCNGVSPSLSGMFRLHPARTNNYKHKPMQWFHYFFLYAYLSLFSHTFLLSYYGLLIVCYSCF